MIRVVTPVLGMLLILSAQAGDVFKWTDDAGVVQYTQAPPEGRSFDVVKQQRAPATVPSAAASSSPATAANDLQTAGADSVSDAKKANCDIARKNIDVLSTKSTILMADPETGENRRLTEEERQAQLEQANKDIGYFCD